MSVEDNEVVVLSEDERERWRKRQQAASLYNELGNMRLVSEKTGVPYDTLCNWKAEPWWVRLIDELRATKAAQRGKKVDGLIEESLEIVADRLKKGDIYVTKEGKIKRVPVKLRDVATLTSEMMRQQNILDEQASRLSSVEATTQELLLDLAKEFKKFNRTLNKSAAETITFVEKED
jgi:hypothetical protein